MEPPPVKRQRVSQAAQVPDITEDSDLGSQISAAIKNIIDAEQDDLSWPDDLSGPSLAEEIKEILKEPEEGRASVRHARIPTTRPAYHSGIGPVTSHTVHESMNQQARRNLTSPANHISQSVSMNEYAGFASAAPGYLTQPIAQGPQSSQEYPYLWNQVPTTAPQYLQSTQLSLPASQSMQNMQRIYGLGYTPGTQPSQATQIFQNNQPIRNLPRSPRAELVYQGHIQERERRRQYQRYRQRQQGIHPSGATAVNRTVFSSRTTGMVESNLDDDESDSVPGR